MRKPIRPKEPIIPIKPKKMLEHDHYVCDVSGDYFLSDFLEKAQDKYGDEVSYENLVLVEMTGYEYNEYEIYYNGKIENKDYDVQLKKYEKKMKSYNKKYSEYKEKLKEYKKKHQEWSDFKKEKEIEEKEKLFEKLKKELNK